MIQLNSTLQVRHGVMLVGPAGGGKTTTRQILKRALVVLPTIQAREQQQTVGTGDYPEETESSKTAQSHVVRTSLLLNNYPAKLRGISSDTWPKRPLAELAKIRRYSARLSRIIVLLFNKLITNLSFKVFESFHRHFLQFFFFFCCDLQNYIYRRIYYDKYREQYDYIWTVLQFVE